MAVVNRTPDSFFDQGAYLDDAAAMAAVDRAVAEGAALVDLGGVRAGPGEEVSEDEEVRRVVPFVAAVRRRHPTLAISVDTWRAGVGRAACEAGADLLNDAWQGADPGLAVVAAEHGAALVCSHAGGLPPRTDPHRVAYDDVMADVVATVTGLADRAVAAGVRAGRDPGGRGARLRQEHLPLARGDPAAGRAGGDRLAGAGGGVEQEVPRRGARRATRTAGWRPPSRRPRSAPGTARTCSGPTRWRRPGGCWTPSAPIRGTRAPAVSRRALA